MGSKADLEYGKAIPHKLNYNNVKCVLPKIGSLTSPFHYYALLECAPALMGISPSGNLVACIFSLWAAKICKWHSTKRRFKDIKTTAKSN